MAYDTSKLAQEPIDGEVYVGQINSAKVVKSKSSDNIMLKMAVDIISGESLGYTIWHQFMLVKPGDERTTARWMARAERDINLILGYSPILPTEVGEVVDDVKALVGEAFEFVVQIQDSEEYGPSARIKRVLGSVDPDDVAVDLADLFVADNPLPAEEGAVL